MPEVNVMMQDSNKLPGGIPLDPVRVVIESVTRAGLDNVSIIALPQLIAEAKKMKANTIYGLKRENALKEGYLSKIYDVIYTAKTCRMNSENHLE